MRLLFYIFTVVLCSCYTRGDAGFLYARASELEENGDTVLAEIAKQNPEIRELVHVTRYDYLTNTTRIKYPDAVIQEAKASYFILLVLPGDFSFISNEKITTNQSISFHRSSDFVKQLLSNMSTIKDVSLLNGIGHTVSYESCTSAAFYYVDVYKISDYSLVLIDISRRGKYSECEGKYLWTPSPL